MSLKIRKLALDLQLIFRNVSVGHCLRIDDLPVQEGIQLCEYITGAENNFSVYILESNLSPFGNNPYIIRTDTAIEKRNQQKESICLIVPAEANNAAITSLGNSFETFDTSRFLKRLENSLFDNIPATIKDIVKRSITQAKKNTQLQTEDVVDFLDELLEKPTLENIGNSLWKVGLMPDKGSGFIERLKLNYDSVQQLARPIRPHSTIRQRLEITKLKKGLFMDRLEHFLLETPLNPPIKRWLRRFTETDGFDFSKWEFPSILPSDLENIRLNKPRRKPDGTLVGSCGDLTCEGTDAPIIAECGHNKKLSVSWTTEPIQVLNVANWQIELIPSREDYSDVDAVELPQIKKKIDQRTARISLDIDTDNLGIEWVQIRITGLDENGVIITDGNGAEIEAISERVFLKQQEVTDEIENKQKLRTYPTLPFGYLEIAQTYSEEEWTTPVPQGWKEGDIDYFSTLVGNSTICRIGISNILRSFEVKALGNSEDFGRYTYIVDDLDKFIEKDIHVRLTSFRQFPSWSIDLIEKFKEQRRKLFKHIRDQYNQSGIIETADWEKEYANTNLFSRTKLYVDAYLQLLETILKDTQQPAEERQTLLQFFLSIDSIELEICYKTGNQKALILLPTHPHRILWLSAYTLLLTGWRNKLLKLPKKKRKSAISVDHLVEVTPANVPFIIPSEFSANTQDNWYIFARNIGFFYGLFLSPACTDWTRVTADILHFLSYHDEITPTDVQPERISEDIDKYLRLHPYCKNRGIKIGVINPGNGKVLSVALQKLLISNNTEELLQDFPKIKRLEISSIAHSPLPIEIEGFENDLYRQFYLLENIANDATSLYPAFSLSLTERKERPNFANGEQHISFNFDAAHPKISLESLSDSISESISFYGLMNRWQSDSYSEYGQLKWRYWLAVSKPERFEKHPEDPRLTDMLINISKQQSTALAFLLNTDLSQEYICCLTSIVGPDERGFIEHLHQKSDWVFTIDRFFGPDFFDSPNDPFLSEISKKYLIDYSPDFTEGLGDRLLVTTCWQDELTQIIGKKLEKINLPYSEESIINLVNALKTLSGTYALQLFEDNEEWANKTIAIGVTLHFIIKNKNYQNFLLIPIYCHQNLFEDIYSLCDFLLINISQQKIEITCINTTIDESGILNESMKERLSKTVDYLQNKYFIIQEDDEDKIGSPLERARLIMLMRYYLLKAVRYGLIDKDRLDKYSDLFSRVEAGKTQPTISETAYIICTGEIEESYKDTEQDGVKTIILGRHILSDPASVASEESKASQIDIEDVIITPPVKEDNKVPIADVVIQSNEIECTGQRLPYPENIEVNLGIISNGQHILWKPSVQGSPHVFILGIPGQGKSVTINTLLIELQRHGVGTLTFDFHGQFSDPQNPFRRLCNATIWDASNGLPFSPFEADMSNDVGQQSWKTQSFALADIFSYVCEFGDIQRDGVYRAISSCYKDAKRHGINAAPTINDLSRKIELLESNKEIKNVSARCRPLLEMNVFNPQELGNEWDILGTTKHGLVINVKEIGSETVQLAISAFVLRKIYKEILLWEESKTLKLAIVLDEAHRLAKDKTLPLIMQEARKFGVLVIVASQNVNHFHENVLGNAGTKILFRTNHPDSRKVSSMVQMRSGIDPKNIIEQLKTGQAIVQTPEMKYGEKTFMKKID